MGSKQYFSLLEDFWLPPFQQRPIKPSPQTPNVSTDMMNMTPDLYAEPAKCHRDPRTMEYVVVPLTTVIVEKADGTLIEHETKHVHIFDGPVAVPTVPPGTYKFRTDNAAWPYMFVSRSLFDTEKKKSGLFGLETPTSTDLDFDSGDKSPLTKRESKRMHKKALCPDCKQSKMCWGVGPTVNGEQEYKCANCHAMFSTTLHDMSTKRI